LDRGGVEDLEVEPHKKGRPMKQKRYTTEQIVYALKQAESGERTVDICRKMGVSE